MQPDRSSGTILQKIHDKSETVSVLPDVQIKSKMGEESQLPNGRQPWEVRKRGPLAVS